MAKKQTRKKGKGNYGREVNGRTRSQSPRSGVGDKGKADLIAKSPAYGSGDARACENDPAWWNKTGQLAKDTSTFSTNAAIGSKQIGFEAGVPYYTPAGLMRMDYIPFFGSINDVTHPINMAARQMYDFINSKNSRNASYDPSDLMVYVIAIASAWSLHAWIKRLIGIYNVFSALNHYWPDEIMRFMNVKRISTHDDIVTWRNVANRMALKLNMFAVPDGIDYFKRAMHMNMWVYKDDPTEKAALMFFNPKAFFKYNWTESATDAQLTLEPFGLDQTDGITPEYVENYFTNLLNGIINNTDISTISSDIIKAYGLDRCFTLPALTENEVTAPAYVPEMLMQINNARVLQVPYTFWSSYNISQNPSKNCLIAGFSSNPTVADWGVAGIWKAVKDKPIPINFPMDNPTSDAFIEATRLMFACDPSATAADSEITTCSTEVIVDVHYCKYRMQDNNWTTVDVAGTNLIKFQGTDVGYYQNMAGIIGDYAKFACAPMQYVVTQGTGGYINPSFMKCMSDIQNLSTLSYNDLYAMNESCILSVFSPHVKV